MHSPRAMNQWREEMKARTRAFSVAVVAFLERTPDNPTTKRRKEQMMGAACGTHLNRYTACRARTHKEFAAELGVVLKDAAEAEECFDVFFAAKLGDRDECARLRHESKELRAIFAKASRTANENEERWPRNAPVVGSRDARDGNRRTGERRTVLPSLLPADSPSCRPAFPRPSDLQPFLPAFLPSCLRSGLPTFSLSFLPSCLPAFVPVSCLPQSLCYHPLCASRDIS